MQRQNIINDTGVSTAIAVSLACSFAIAGGAGLFVFYWLNTLGIIQVFAVILALVCSVGIGLLATANIQYGMFLLHLTLARLADGRPTSVPQSHWLWPLSALFRSLVRINLRVDEVFQRERLANEYHEQLLQQASEAAATEERNHLARDLHDSIKQQIFSIRMSAIAAKGHIQTGVTKAQEALEDILRSTNEAQVEMQALLQQLRSAPLENMSLAEAVRTQAEALQYRSGAYVSVEMADLPAANRFPLHMQESLFRIVQEAFANIARHARAQHVYYTQSLDEKTLLVVIRDDGQGFNTQSVHKGMGLANIHERVRSLNGTTKIESEPGKGTTLSIQIPLLLAPETKQQEEQEEYTVQKLISRIQGGLHLNAIISTLTMVAFITGVGVFTTTVSINTRNIFVLITGFCLSLMFYGLASSHLAIARLRNYRSEEDRMIRAFSLSVHRGWEVFLRLVLFASWQIILLGLYLLLPIVWWARGLFFLLIAGSILTLVVLEHRQAKRAQDCYYPLLPGNILAWEVRYRWRSLRLRVILYLCLSITFLISRAVPFFPPVTPGQWLRDYTLFTFLALCIGMLVDIRQLQPWRKLAKMVL
jgi:signal transduction histidine kinase